MHIIGLCGGSGSGKGAVGEILMSCGVPVVDCDAIYHALVSAPGPCMEELVCAFGAGIVAPGGGLDRRALGTMVFSDSGGEKRKLLNRITHKYVLAEVDASVQRAADAGAWAVAVDMPLLFEAGYDRTCSEVVAVLAPEAERVRRIVARDGITEEQARARMATQHDDAYLTARADYVLHNTGTLAQLNAAVRQLLVNIKSRKEYKQ